MTKILKPSHEEKTYCYQNYHTSLLQSKHVIISFPLSKFSHVLRTKRVLTCYLNCTIHEGGRKLGTGPRHKHTNCIEGKCSIHIAHCTFFSYSLANKGCFSFQGTTNIWNMGHFPFAVTNWFTCRKLSYTTRTCINRYFLSTDHRLPSYKVQEEHLLSSSEEKKKLFWLKPALLKYFKRFWHNLEARKASSLRGQKLFIYCKALDKLFWTMTALD